MFRRLRSEGADEVALTVDGAPVAVRRGETVAAALLLAGHAVGRTTPISNAPRGPYCMMGVCFECLVEIDGIGNRQSCMVEAQPGMRVRRQVGARTLDGTP